MIVARYIAEFLRDKGITHVFGYDGSMMLKIADEISLTDGIEYYQGFHEQASSFAADAYGRVLHKMGVVLVTSGPGAVNALAGCADAYLDSIPLMIITGQDRLAHLENNPGVRLNGFQDLDIVSIAAPITKYAVQITEPGKIGYELEKAFHIANEGRKGSVLIDVPMDIQFEEVPEEFSHFYPEENQGGVVKQEIITDICNEIYASEKPVIIAGGGIHTADAEKELFEFVSKTDIPTVTTLNGHDACSLSLGSSGFYGLPEANLALYNADLLIALGTRFGEQQAGKFVNEFTHAKVIHIDIDEKELGRVLPQFMSVQADVKKLLGLLNESIERKRIPDYNKWKACIFNWKERYKEDLHVNNEGIDPLRLVEYIGEHLPEDAIFTNDVGQNTMWVCQGLIPKGRQRLVTSSGYASMGFSLPAAIGAKMACPDQVVVSFSGDGGFHMNLQELQFVKLHALDIKFVVFNNNTLGMMREVQKIYYNNNYVGSNEKEFTCVDLKKVAELYDLEYLAISSETEFIRVGEALNDSKAIIIDCRLPMDTHLKNWKEFMQEHPEAMVIGK